MNSVRISVILKVTEEEKGKPSLKQAEGCSFHLSKKRPLLLRGLLLLIAIPTLAVTLQGGAATEGTKGLDSTPAFLREVLALLAVVK